MNAVEAKAELTKILRPFRALEELEDVLAVAAKLDSERIGVTRALAQAKQDLDSTKAAKEVADRDYTDRQTKIEAGMKALRAQYQAQEANFAEQTAVLQGKLGDVQRELEAARKGAVAKMNELQVEAGKKQADLEKAYGTRRAELEAEQKAAQVKLDSTKAALADLLKKVS